MLLLLLFPYRMTALQHVRRPVGWVATTDLVRVTR